MIDSGLPLRVVAMDANGGYDTHENQAATLSENLGLLSSSLAAFQATSRRAASPTACSCTCGASSAAVRPPTARAPTTERAARA